MDCRIRVSGHLDAVWSARLAGLRIVHEDGGVSLITGELPDQAALYGVVIQLFRLGLALVSVETSDAAPHTPASTTRDSGSGDVNVPPVVDRGPSRST